MRHSVAARLEPIRLGQARLGKGGAYRNMAGLIWAIIVVLFVIWLIGLVVHIGGGLIHLLIVIAVILLIYNLLTGRGARV